MAAVGLVRVADALLRTCGGQAVTLRMPGLAVAGDAAEQVGLAVPVFQDYVLGPVTFRKIRPRVSWAAGAEGERAARYELLVSASAVERLVGSVAFDSVSVLFGQALGVLVGELVLQVDSCTAVEMAGGAILYRVLLHGELRVAV